MENNNFIELPFNVDSIIQTECWTYHKFAILETFEAGRAWISSHYSMYLDGAGSVWLGNSDNPIFGMKYYSDIFSFNKLDLWNISTDDIIQTVKLAINNKQYIVSYILNPPEFRIVHEYLIYGYNDEKKTFLSTRVNQFTERFEGFELPYEDYKTGYHKLREWFYDKRCELEKLIQWYFPLTSFGISNYTIPDWNVEMTIRNIESFVNGLPYNVNEKFIDDKDINLNKVFYGLSSIIGLSDHLYALYLSRMYFNSKDIERKSNQLLLSLRKEYEYIEIILLSFNWLTEYINKSCNIETEKKTLKDILKSMEKIYFLAIKFKNNNDWDLLISMKEKLAPLYNHLKEVIMSAIVALNNVIYYV